MSVLSNSVFCSTEITLLRSCFKQAVEHSGSKCLVKIEKKESKKLVRDYIVEGLRQIIQDSSYEGHWKDERDHVLSMAYSWIFISWMNGSMGGENISENFTPINTTFYLEVVKSLKFEKFLVQCLCKVKEEATEILTLEVVNHVADCPDEHFLLDFLEHCLKQLNKNNGYNCNTINRIFSILFLITNGMKDQILQLKIIEKLAHETRKLLLELEQHDREDSKDDGEKDFIDFGFSADLFTRKQNFIEFESNMKWVSKQTKIKNWGFHSFMQVESDKKMPVTVLENQKLCDTERPEVRSSTLQLVLRLVGLIKQLVMCDWRSMFCWEATALGNPIIQRIKEDDCQTVLFNVFTTCLSLQRHIKYIEEERKNVQVLINFLEPYFQDHATLEQKTVISEILDEGGGGKTRGVLIASEVETDESLNEELEKAIFSIHENLFGAEKFFKWLLMTEDIYEDQRWLECVVANAKKFVSTTTVKMLLDVLCLLQESASQESHKNIYKSIKQVILDLVPCLSPQEQAEVIVYNFDLTCLHFESPTDQSLFLLSHYPTEDMSWMTEILTVTMNKIINKAEDGFSHEVITGITKGALIAPYVTLKGLLTEAVKHTGHEKVICELLQMMPCFAGLHCVDHSHLLVRALNEILTSLSSKKQEGQFLKLVGVLLQPYMHPALKIKEPPLLSVQEFMAEFIQPLLTVEDNGGVSSTLVLNILLTAMSSSQTSRTQQHWILDEKPFEILFTMLEMYQDCKRFWEDWVSEASEDEAMDRDDFALDEAWTEMNVALKLVDEHLIPLLAEAISQEPSKYASLTNWLTSQLEKLDWIASIQMLPLLQDNVIMCTIKLPKPLVRLTKTSQFNVLPLSDTEPTESFWTMYFKSCALSNEVYGIYLSKLRDGHPKETGDDSDCEEIVEAMANVLPFSTWLQWQRLLNIAKELFTHGYLSLKEVKWKGDLVGLPEIDSTDLATCCIVKTSGLLVSVLRCISSKAWATSYVWNITLKNYVSKIKELSLTVQKENQFLVTCHLLTHLNYVAFKIIPEGFRENIAIVVLDLFNNCLSTIPNVTDKNSKHLEYLNGIIDMIPQTELQMTMNNKIQNVLSNNY